MIAFTFFKIYGKNDLKSFEIEHCPSIHEAQLHARDLLGNTDYRAIEIWDGSTTLLVERCGTSGRSDISRGRSLQPWEPRPL